MQQRNKGYDSAAKSDLKGMQIAEESYLTDYNTYTTSVTGASSLATEGFTASPNTTNSVIGINGSQSYCLKSVSQSGTTWYLGSATGGPDNTVCTTS